MVCAWSSHEPMIITNIIFVEENSLHVRSMASDSICDFSSHNAECEKLSQHITRKCIVKLLLCEISACAKNSEIHMCAIIQD
ncbi:MAG: hypothetical protein ACKPKO_05645, partial [Candidatus Fonsibacter sp.]